MKLRVLLLVLTLAGFGIAQAQSSDTTAKPSGGFAPRAFVGLSLADLVANSLLFFTDPGFPRNDYRLHAAVGMELNPTWRIQCDVGQSQQSNLRGTAFYESSQTRYLLGRLSWLSYGMDNSLSYGPYIGYYYGQRVSVDSGVVVGNYYDDYILPGSTTTFTHGALVAGFDLNGVLGKHAEIGVRTQLLGISPALLRAEEERGYYQGLGFSNGIFAIRMDVQLRFLFP